jgi:hypothetical protein
MAITWMVSHPERLIVAVAKDRPTATDLLFCMDELTKAGMHSYRKIFDLTGIGQAMPRADVQLLGERTVAIKDSDQFGPMAIVVASDGIAGLVRIYEETTAPKRPVWIFRNLYAARAWVDELAPPDQVAEAAHE